ncbi:MAG: hypothetical protein KJ600_05370 [Nanoarchaeota archaeon]|nr:hypothetical protein [Nanoarchaeota archaeon]MBU1103957.1 hypothetical protein [Nanoarchaeota archaeon]
MDEKRCLLEMMCPEGHFVTVAPFNHVSDGDVIAKEHGPGYICYNCNRTYSAEKLREVAEKDLKRFR